MNAESGAAAQPSAKFWLKQAKTKPVLIGFLFQRDCTFKVAPRSKSKIETTNETLFLRFRFFLSSNTKTDHTSSLPAAQQCALARHDREVGAAR